MEYDRVSYEFSQEELDGFRSDIDSLRSRIKPAQVTLHPSLRRSLKTMGDRSHPFVEQTLQYATENPHICMGFLDVNEYKRDWDFTMNMKSIIKNIETLVQNLKDTYLASSADAYAHARKFYAAAKIGKQHNVANAATIVENLRTNFKKDTEEDEKKQESKTQNE
jgi:hypothetical protein